MASSSSSSSSAARRADAAAADGAAAGAPVVKDHNKYRRDKPWDHDGIDHWAVPEWKPEMMTHSLVEESSFATLFPQYREKYLREVWPAVTKALEVSRSRARGVATRLPPRACNRPPVGTLRRCGALLPREQHALRHGADFVMRADVLARLRICRSSPPASRLATIRVSRSALRAHFVRRPRASVAS